MSTNKPVFTLRMNENVLEKIKIIAEKSKRSTSMQVEYAVEAFIKDYEKVNGVIKIEDNGIKYLKNIAEESQEYDT